MAFEVKECPKCQELREKTTGFKKHARICRTCEQANREKKPEEE